jgi:hypothetical protein
MPSLAGTIKSVAHPPLRLITRSPFVPGRPRPVIVHASHHKSGTAWFQGVLHRVARRFMLKVQRLGYGEALRPDSELVLDGTSRSSIEAKLVRGSHMVRDPRDVAVSGYHYHLWTKENWAHKPRERLGGRSYQEHLNSLGPQEGLAAEIELLAGTVFGVMARWDYDRLEYLELRYEDVIADEEMWFERLFRHYGFSDRGVSAAMEIAKSRSFSETGGRELGVVEERSHRRSGVPGQWRSEFGPEHVALFKRLTGPLLVRLGYEKDEHW